VSSLPWAAAAAAALGLDAAAMVADALGGLEERGAVYALDGDYDTRLPHEPRGPLARGPDKPSLSTRRRRLAAHLTGGRAAAPLPVAAYSL
jgi:hypothetical protein